MCREGAGDWRQRYIDGTLVKVRLNVERFGDSFPYYGTSMTYQKESNTHWGAGFWPGMLWLAYQATGDRVFANKALLTLQSFQVRLGQKSSLDHDVGFLFTLSSVFAHKLTGDSGAASLAIQAAYALAERFSDNGLFIPAHGPLNDPELAGRVIIDTLMNLPLLFWAAHETGDLRLRQVAIDHARTACRFQLRPDGSVFQVYLFEPATGRPLGPGKLQGASEYSIWTRGMGWGLYGWALAYRATGLQEFLEAGISVARCLTRLLPDGDVPPWDFADPSGPRDSSAAAIACCGLLELASVMAAADERNVYLREADRILRTLCDRAWADQGSEALLCLGSYHVPERRGVNGATIWGDYFCLEALLRMSMKEALVLPWYS